MCAQPEGAAAELMPNAYKLALAEFMPAIVQVLWPKKGAFDNANDLKEQAFYRFIAKTYWGHIALQFAVLYALGGMPWFVWLGCVRVSFVAPPPPPPPPPPLAPSPCLVMVVGDPRGRASVFLARGVLRAPLVPTPHPPPSNLCQCMLAEMCRGQHSLESGIYSSARAQQHFACVVGVC